MNEVDLLVIGAGPAGLGAARELARRGVPRWAVLEATDRVGGLARSVTDDAGFTYDIGGHVLFSHYPRHRAAVDEALRGNSRRIARRAWIWTQGRYVPYPFQLHLEALDPEVTLECLLGLLDADAHRKDHGGPPAPTDFSTWIDATFGAGIARHFMRPYNRKVWATPLHEMSAGWIAERVATVDVERVLRTIVLGEDPAQWGPNATFRYPLHGGTGAIYDALAAPVADRIRMSSPAVAVDPSRREVRAADGARWRYGALLSTMPLDDLVARCTEAPADVRAAAAGLRSISTTVVGVGIDRPTEDDRTWVYYPDADLPFHRVTVLSNYSPHVTPGRDQTLLLTERSHPHPTSGDDRTVAGQVIEGLVTCGLLDAADRDRVRSTWVHHEAKSYPVPTVDRDRRLAVIEPWLARHGIASRGRFGAWRYEIGNMDHAYEMGAEWVDRRIDGTQEQVWRPV